MTATSGYSRFFRATQMLWREHQGVHLEPAYKRHCQEVFEDYATRAELAWPADPDRDWPHSVSGSDHLMEHVAHDLALPERQEVTFRIWFNRCLNHGFTPAVKDGTR